MLGYLGLALATWAAALRVFLWRGSWGATLFRLAYLAYTRTPAGLLIHAAQLRSAKKKARPHTAVVAAEPVDCGPFEVLPVPVLGDNYAYLVIDKATREAAAVDPADADAVLAAAAAADARLTCVLSTHYHLDHSGGNAALAARVPGLVVYGSGAEPVQARTAALADGDEVRVGEGTTLTALATPCHTPGHLCFAAPRRAVFSGDTLFIGGVGKFFEGSAAQMAGSLGRLAALPPGTRVFPGHEYTVANLEFAAHVYPDDERVQRKLHWARALRAERRTTVPSTIEEEMATNPFMRVLGGGGAAVGEMRGRKDSWRG